MEGLLSRHMLVNIDEQNRKISHRDHTKAEIILFQKISIHLGLMRTLMFRKFKIERFEIQCLKELGANCYLKVITGTKIVIPNGR